LEFISLEERMSLKKIQYSLAEVAKEWSELTGKNITVDELLQIASDTLLPFFLSFKGVQDARNQGINHPVLEICAYIYQPLEVAAIYRKNEAAEDNPPERYIGRLFLRPDHIFTLKNKGSVSIKEAVDTDSISLYRFTELVDISKDMLVITSSEKIKFEEKYLIPQVQEMADTKNITNCLDATSPYYSDELAVAIEVWNFLSDNHKVNKKSIKEQARQYIDIKLAYKQLSDSAKDRVCTLINWQKEGGAPKS
jgi:hypothetical protein